MLDTHWLLESSFYSRNGAVVLKGRFYEIFNCNSILVISRM